MKPTLWFGIVLLTTILSLLVVILVPSDSQFIVARLVRYIIGFGFVAFLPGYCLVNFLFPDDKRLELVEKAVLSTALSFGLAGLAGLFLGLSPIGINFGSIVISLTLIVLVLAVLAFARKIKIA